MKTAYLFSGHSRTWAQCVRPFFDKIYKHAPGDIFIHTWDCVNSTHGAHWNGWNYAPIRDISREKIAASGILNAYNPKQLVIEKERGTDYWTHLYPHVPSDFLGIKNLLHSQKTAFEVSKLHGIYDRYIFTRMDINYTSDLIAEELHSDYYIVSKANHFSNEMIFDFWSIANFTQAEIKSNYLSEVDNYWFNKDVTTYFYEHALNDYLIDKKILVQRSNVTYNVPRITGGVTDYNH
jgi:hypothetical protein